MRTTGQLAEALENPNYRVKLEALKEITDLESLGSSLIDSIKGAVQDSNVQVRSMAITTFFAVTKNSIVGFDFLFDRLLVETSSLVAEGLAYILSEKIIENNRSRSVISRLDEILNFILHAKPYIQRHLCYALGRINNKKTLDILIKCAKSSIADVRIVAIKAIMNTEGTRNLLREIVKEETDEFVISRFSNFLGEMEYNNERTEQRRLGTCQGSV